MFRQLVLPRLVFWFYRLLSWTWRKRTVESPALKKLLDEGQPILLAHWHGDELAMLYLVKRFGLVTMTSTSKDGALIDYVIRRLGGQTSRGSSTRQGMSALKALLRLMKKGHPCSMAVDGPKGPLHKVKPGVFEISRLNRAWIFPVGSACSRGLHFKKSWNKTFLPKPFSQVLVYFGDPIEPLSKAQDPKDPQLALLLEERLHNAKRYAATHIAQQNPRC